MILNSTIQLFAGRLVLTVGLGSLCVLAHSALTHNTLQNEPIQSAMWVDFALRKGGSNQTGAGQITPERLEFIANNYAIISLEKCLASPHDDTIN